LQDGTAFLWKMKKAMNINKDRTGEPTQDNQQTTSEAAITKNPNPRANENLDAEDRQTADADDVGSEITDGEDA